MNCPGCNSYTSNVLADVERGDPCRNCGLSADAIMEVNAVRDMRGDEKLKTQLEAALLRAGRAESVVQRLQSKVYRVRQAIEEHPEDYANP